jgi:hypothetical protein
MRWNRRRRRVTSVVYMKSDKPAEVERPASPWNSLEKAKLAVGVLTPLLIASFGVYVTIHSHADDVERAADAEVRARKAAALPIIADLDQQYKSFLEIASEVVYTTHSAVVVRPGDNELVLAQLNRLSAASDEYAKRFQEDWLKLRSLLNDESEYEDLHRMSQSTVVGPVTASAHDCVEAVINEKEENLPKKCDALLVGNKASSCQFLINYRLERFDLVEPVALATQSNRALCPAATP